MKQPGGADVSVLTAAYDPGRFLKYLGSLMVCVGIAIMFYLRSYVFQRVPVLALGSRSSAEQVSGESNAHPTSAGAA